ncbi:S-protein homolog 5-like [Mercurialis annua]|uniref:S-protein homolog 5-like n=1 Tax=Mercurialis annua TaxID=3986 RepID=UPI00215F4490|nr:S-protein homolog 5-like [Mercurialis annua]
MILSNFKQSILVLCLLASVIVSEARHHVHIRNDIGANIDLTVHCKSKNDDLGYHLLHPQEIFEFSFKPNIWGSTLFFCSFAWADQFKYFTIFKGGFYTSFCQDCFWMVHVDGLCLLKENSGAPGACLKWDNSLILTLQVEVNLMES